MDAWQGGDNVLGDAVPRTVSGKVAKDELRNGNDARGNGYLVAIGSKSARFRRKHKEKFVIIALLLMIIILLLVLIIIAVCYRFVRPKPIRICETTECLRSAANLVQSMDFTADPCDDFYQYTCGKWEEEHPIPESSLSNDWFSDRQRKIYREIKAFLNYNDTTDIAPKPVEQARDMYKACIDTDTLDKLGLKPILDILEQVGLPQFPTFINTTPSFDYANYNFKWLDVVIKIKTVLSLDVLIGFDIYPDPKNGSVNKMILGTPETTDPLPRNVEIEKHLDSIKKEERRRLRDSANDDQFNILERVGINDVLEDTDDDDNDADATITATYLEYLAVVMKNIFDASDGPKLTNLQDEDILLKMVSSAAEYVKLSTLLYELAEAEDNQTLSDLDSEITVPEYKVDDIQAETDRIVMMNNVSGEEIWKPYISGVYEASDVVLDFETEMILVSEPDMKYMSLLAAILARTPPVLIELYLWMETVEILITHTTTDMVKLNDEYTKKITGIEMTSSRSTHCASGVNEMMGMAVSYGLAQQEFLDVTKPKVELMLANIKTSLSSLVSRVTWMDEWTKIVTIDKIFQMRNLIGFPEWLLVPGKLEKYYENITVARDTHLSNMIGILQVKLRTTLNSLRKPRAFTWATDPSEVNAFHTFQSNAITVPLAMLQYPFYNLGLEALNYGSIGTILGHEITHGFDNIGRQYDKNGNMIQWWSNETIHSFINKTECFVKQYNKYYVEEVDEFIDGHKTLGENIADFGGVREAFGAYSIYVKKNGKEMHLPGFERFTHDQLFYLSYGNLWCGAHTIKSLKWDLKDEHSPGPVRLKGVLQNSPDFAKTWNCPKNSTMSPEKRCALF